jgi:hypothetical protein
MNEIIENNILVTMVKKGSPQSVVFFADQEDDFMIHVAKVQTRTGEITRESLIIRPDVDQWISYYRSNGFEIQTNHVEKEI